MKPILTTGATLTGKNREKRLEFTTTITLALTRQLFKQRFF